MVTLYIKMTFSNATSLVHQSGEFPELSAILKSHMYIFYKDDYCH